MYVCMCTVFALIIPTTTKTIYMQSKYGHAGETKIIFFNFQMSTCNCMPRVGSEWSGWVQQLRMYMQAALFTQCIVYMYVSMVC